jgi:PilZ domain
MVQSPEEKRKAPRHSYASPVTYTGKVGTLAMQPQEVLFQGKIVDLSSGGIGMETRAHSFLEMGSLVRTWLPMSSVPVNVPVLARVQWVRDKDPGAGQRVGLMFVL